MVAFYLQKNVEKYLKRDWRPIKASSQEGRTKSISLPRRTDRKLPCTKCCRHYANVQVYIHRDTTSIMPSTNTYRTMH
jgi:hypothetical protein